MALSPTGTWRKNGYQNHCFSYAERFWQDIKARKLMWQYGLILSYFRMKAKVLGI